MLFTTANLNIQRKHIDLSRVFKALAEKNDKHSTLPSDLWSPCGINKLNDWLFKSSRPFQNWATWTSGISPIQAGFNLFRYPELTFSEKKTISDQRQFQQPLLLSIWIHFLRRTPPRAEQPEARWQTIFKLAWLPYSCRSVLALRTRSGNIEQSQLILAC